jgi:hypothetical protein
MFMEIRFGATFVDPSQALSFTSALAALMAAHKPHAVAPAVTEQPALGFASPASSSLSGPRSGSGDDETSPAPSGSISEPTMGAGEAVSPNDAKPATARRPRAPKASAIPVDAGATAASSPATTVAPNPSPSSSPATGDAAPATAGSPAAVAGSLKPAQLEQLQKAAVRLSEVAHEQKWMGFATFMRELNARFGVQQLRYIDPARASEALGLLEAQITQLTAATTAAPATEIVGF